MTGSPRTWITPTPRAGSCAPSSSTMRASSPSSSRPSDTRRRALPRPAGTARCSRASRSASTSSTTMPAPDGGERHRDRRLGHAVAGHDRLGPQSVGCAGRAQVLDVGGIDLFGARQRPPQRGQVELAGRRQAAQASRQQLVGEVRGGGHRPLVLVNQLDPQQVIAQKIHRRDLDQLGAEVHRDGQVADHAHVVEAGQPADDHVGAHVELGADEHRLGVGDDIARG